MSTLPVIEEILRNAEHPMSVREIVELAGARLPTKSKTPDTVVARDLSMDIKRKGDASLFVRTSPGRYAIRDKAGAWMPSNGEETSRPSMEPGQVDNGGATTPVLSSAITGERAATLPATTRPARRAETNSDVAPA